jgi:hypothetical protein
MAVAPHQLQAVVALHHQQVVVQNQQPIQQQVEAQVLCLSQAEMALLYLLAKAQVLHPIQQLEVAQVPRLQVAIPLVRTPS